LDANTADQIIVNGPISLSGPLNVVVRKGGQTVPSFKIIDNRGSAPVSGTFAGLPEGASVQAGSSRFTITYQGGDGNDVVLLSGVSVVLTQSAVATVFGEPFSVSATVAGTAPSVAFTDGVVPLGSAVPENGVAAITIANLGVGSHLIGAQFSGATATITHNVARGSTLLSVDASFGSAQGLNLMIHVQPAGPARGLPGGAISVEIDGAKLGTAQLTQGAASIPAGILTAGTHTIAAHYAGDSNFESADAVKVVVMAPPRGRSVRH
jgi:hypothetical protein